MSEDKGIKLIKAAKELNIGIGTIVDFLASKGYKVDRNPMTALNSDMYSTLVKQFAADKSIKEEAKQINIGKIRRDEPGFVPDKPAEQRSKEFEREEILIKNAGTFNSTTANKPKETEKPQERTDGSLPGVKAPKLRPNLLHRHQLLLHRLNLNQRQLSPSRSQNQSRWLHKHLLRLRQLLLKLSQSLLYQPQLLLHRLSQKLLRLPLNKSQHQLKLNQSQ
jgi:hypothetical protein